MASEFDLGSASLGTEVDLDGLREGIDTAEQESSSRFAKIGDVIGGALKIGILAAGASVVAGVVGIGVAAFDTASQVNQASNDIQAELGVTAEKADELGETALRVWGNNWGDSIDDVKTSLVEVRKQVKGLSDEELEGATAKALALRDSFGVEVAESTNAVNVLMEKFGLTSDQAFDFLAKGYQKGLNNSGDFLESLTEYGVQFSEAGFKADEFFSALESGQQGASSLGTDKIADLVKEGRIRIAELSDDVIESFKTIGDVFVGDLNKALVDGTANIDDVTARFSEMGITISESGRQAILSGQSVSSIWGTELAGAIERGEISIADAQKLALQGLGQMDNATHQNMAGVALFGTQWEDLGSTAALSVNFATTSLGSMAGATDSLNAKYDNFPALFEGFKRSALVALEPLGQKLLEVANSIMPSVQVAFAWLQENLPPIIDGAVAAIDGFITTVGDILTTIQPVTDFIGDNLTPILAGLAAMLLVTVVPAFIAWAGASAAAAAATIAALAPVIIPLAAIGAAVALLVAAWQRDWGGIRTTITSFWENTGRPIFDQLKGWLADKIPVALQTLSDFWTNTLQPALRKVWDFVSANIIPILGALANVWLALVKKEIELLAALWSNVLWPALQKVGDFIGTTVIPKLSELARVVSETLGPKLSWLNDHVLKPVAGWFGDIGSAVEGVLEFLGRLASAIDAIEIPSWLQGHSPPPMADWFSYIADEAARVADIAGGLTLPGVGGGALGAPALAAGGGTGVHITIEERGLRDLIRVTVREELGTAGRNADTRSRTGF